MLARRIIAVSPDKAFGKQLATALKAAGGAVDAHQNVEELGKDIQAALVVLHLDGDLATAAAEIMPRLGGDTRVIIVLPRTNLAACVDLMQSSERVAGMLVAENFDRTALTAMATRVLLGDIFGLEKMIPWGTLVHSQLVGDYQEKALCISQLSEFAELMGVRRKYREAIEQCADEMLMNALYDAPVDEQGKPIFSEIPTKTRISLRVEQKAVVQYACDGKRFVLSVRDAFGTLERSTVLRYLYKCLHAEQQIDRKAGGAGLGLYLMVNSATTVYFNVLPGVATEAVCVFDLETPKLQLEDFGFFTEKIDAAGRLATGPSRRLPIGHPVERRAPTARPVQTPRGLVAGLGVAIFALFALIGLLAYPRLFGVKKTRVTFEVVPKGAHVEIEGKSAGNAADGTLVVPDLEIGRAYPVTVQLDGYEPKEEVVQPRGNDRVSIRLVELAPKVELDSLPTGATVEQDGKALGTTPIALTMLPAGHTVELVLKKPGYHDAVAKLDVPGPGKELKYVQPLAVSDELARVRLESDPSGAQVVQNGQVLAGVVTPAEVLVEAEKPQRFELRLPHHVPAMLEAFTPPRGAEGIVKRAKLANGVEVHFESNLDGKISIANAPHCREQATPVSCMLAPGTYTVEYNGAVNAHATRTIKVDGKDLTEKLEFGYVQAASGKQLHIAGGATVTRTALEVGVHNVTVGDDTGTHAATVKVTAGQTVTAN